MDATQLITHLRRSRLVDDAALTAIDRRWGTGAAAADVLDALVREGLLTPFQAARLAAGRAGGLVVGPYRVLDELGRGGMGHVYKALHTVMGRLVALKVIAPELARHAQAERWFQREVRAVTRLAHPNVVTAYDAGEENGVHYLAMEYVDGLSLEALVRRVGPLPVAAACGLVAQAAAALQAAHEQGLVHRDIKPGNLLVLRWYAEALEAGRVPTAGTTPAVKVVDFGLAHLQGRGEGTLPAGGGLVGTADYIAPEQARSLHAADARSDLYSLGCTLFFALTGRPPFAGEGAVEKALKHLTEEAPRADRLRPDVPASLAALVARLMAKDPAQRHATPANLARELAPWCASGAGIVTAAPFAPAAPSVPTAEPTRALAVPPPPTGNSPQPRDSRTVALPPAAPNGPASEWVVRLPVADGNGPPVSAALRRDWQRWSRVVAAVARGRRPGIADADYRALHGRLLAACRDHAEAATGERRARFEELERLARPWLTPQALARTEAPLLRDLHDRCRAADRALGGQRWPVGPALAAALLAVAPVLAVLAASPLGLGSLRPAPRVLAAVLASPAAWLAAAAAVTAAGAGLLLRTSRR